MLNQVRPFDLAASIKRHSSTEGKPLDATYLSAPSSEQLCLRRVVLDDGCQPKAQSVRAKPSQSVTSIKPNAAAMIKSYVYTKLPSQSRDTLHRLRFVLFMG